MSLVPAARLFAESSAGEAAASPAEDARPLPFRWPAEWEPQRALWLSWPVNSWIWEGRLAAVQARFAELAALASRYQSVAINAAERTHAAIELALKKAGADLPRIALYPIATDDVWIRDHGPIFTRDAEGKLLLTDWEFNAWGGKFPRFAQDNAVPDAMARALNLPIIRPQRGYILEGGAIESDGQGTLLTSDPVLLNPNRNPGISQAAHGAILQRGLGVQRVISLPEGLPNDDTDGHIDNLARFTPGGVILLSEGEAVPGLAKNRQHLEALGFSVEPLPLPKLPVDAPGSYANYVVINGAVLLPTFGDVAGDRRAAAIVAAAFPDRIVEGFDANLLLAEGGALHCCTLNEFA